MTEYGRIHTDGSRSGGQPLLLPCPFCGEQCAMLLINQGDKWAHYEPTCLEVRTGYNLSNDAPWRDEAIAAWNTRQPTQSDVLKAENERARIVAWLRDSIGTLIGDWIAIQIEECDHLKEKGE